MASRALKDFKYLTEWVKMTAIFVSYGSLAQHSACFKSDTEMK